MSSPLPSRMCLQLLDGLGDCRALRTCLSFLRPSLRAQIHCRGLIRATTMVADSRKPPRRTEKPLCPVATSAMPLMQKAP